MLFSVARHFSVVLESLVSHHHQIEVNSNIIHLLLKIYILKKVEIHKLNRGCTVCLSDLLK